MKRVNNVAMVLPAAAQLIWITKDYSFDSDLASDMLFVDTCSVHVLNESARRPIPGIIITQSTDCDLFSVFIWVCFLYKMRFPLVVLRNFVAHHPWWLLRILLVFIQSHYITTTPTITVTIVHIPTVYLRHRAIPLPHSQYMSALWDKNPLARHLLPSHSYPSDNSYLSVCIVLFNSECDFVAEMVQKEVTVALLKPDIVKAGKQQEVMDKVTKSRSYN